MLGPPAHPAGQTHTEAPAGSRPRRGLTLPDLHFPAEAEAEHRSHTDPSGQETSDLPIFNATQQNLAQLWPREALLEPRDGHRQRLGQGSHSLCLAQILWDRPRALLWVPWDIRAALQPPLQPIGACSASPCILHRALGPRHPEPLVLPEPLHGQSCLSPRSERGDRNPSRATPATAFHGSDANPPNPQCPERAVQVGV